MNSLIAVDSMAERLEEMIKARDILLSTVSHELRSPLARLQLAIGLAKQDPSRLESSLERIQREAARLEEMVDEFLTLSQLESGISQGDEYFELSEVLRIVCDDAKFEAKPSGIEVAIEISQINDLDEWICRGSGKLISRAIENIVRNALRFSQKGHAVQVLLRRTHDRSFRLDVIDEGPGAPPEILKTLFQPFMHRDRESGDGFGLGLSIAQRAIVAHGGSISAHNRGGHGFAVTVLLPASDHQGNTLEAS
jgi:two-component system OmpR family sensor kinase